MNMETVTHSGEARKIAPPILNEFEGHLMVGDIVIPHLPFARAAKLFRKLWTLRDQIIPIAELQPIAAAWAYDAAYAVPAKNEVLLSISRSSVVVAKVSHS